jgi:hypothetical protein
MDDATRIDVRQWVARATAGTAACEDEPVAEDLVHVLSTGSVPEAEVAKAMLEEEGIPVLLKGEAEGPYRMGPVYLFVPAELEARARELLEASA